ncbi:UvrD-helicase domain-containing protein [Streptacidiphilus sp. P02-A3a]|uniref:UvrD-helicase domain-containing protein n=1 Tax=Streptacidiphilus sp. P02-A3a TaxID=2704468 RepID=UPI00210273F0|nr:UvrD-helicase domain-containing protein [Streptacidiphilus sp. P02-A3a]
MGQATRKKGLYIAFNRGIAKDAQRRFGVNVRCGTAHGLAFRAGGHHYQARLDAPRMPSKQAARLLGLDHDLVADTRKITPGHQARLVLGMIQKFCYTADREIMARHMERVNGVDPQYQEELAKYLLPFAHQAWLDLRSLRGRLRFEHDHYLKMWALTEPVLEADFVLLDEAQDTNPVLEEVFLAQHAQRVCVGDPAQQIYAWRFAQDVMSGFPAQHLNLTQSFRFGARIAAAANRWLQHAESDLQISGHGPHSRIGDAPDAQAVLCRSNADAMSEILAYLEQGVPVALAGGGKALARIATAALELQSGRRTSHPELFLFTSWPEVREYVDHDKAGMDLKAIVDLVDTYGAETILRAVERLAPEEGARVVVSTVHKAKGREWDSVRIGAGFNPPGFDEDGIQLPLDPAEARLVYVAVTRAKYLLDPGGITWIDAYESGQKAAADGVIGGVPMIRLSLTGQLQFGASPVSRFMAAHLPDHRALVDDLAVRAAKLPPPVQPFDVQRPDWPALGHAVDYRLRLSLGRPLGEAVAAGVALAGESAMVRDAPAEGVCAALRAAGGDLLTEIEQYLAAPDTGHQERISRLCFVAAHYEAIYRRGQYPRHGLLTTAGPRTGLEDLVAATPAYVVQDLAEQMRLTDPVFAALRALPEQQRVCGPLFAGSADLGGADADFILAGTLIDCKATTRPRTLGRAEVYQLAGYLLLDYHDQYAIDRLGLYLARQGTLIDWSTDEFLHRLGATTTLPRLREQFRTHLKEAQAAAK